MARPFALFLTWTCYGTWLPGDRRGFVSNVVAGDREWLPKLNAPGTPYRANDPCTHERAKRLQKWPTVRLASTDAGCVTHAISAAAAERAWTILRAAVMWNHAHVVVAECPADGPAVRRVLKGVSQAALNRLIGRPKRWWTAGGSDRYLNDGASIDAAVRYVAGQTDVLAEIIDGHVVVRSGKS